MTSKYLSVFWKILKYFFYLGGIQYFCPIYRYNKYLPEKTLSVTRLNAWVCQNLKSSLAPKLDPKLNSEATCFVKFCTGASFWFFWLFIKPQEVNHNVLNFEYVYKMIKKKIHNIIIILSFYYILHPQIYHYIYHVKAIFLGENASETLKNNLKMLIHTWGFCHWN